MTAMRNNKLQEAIHAIREVFYDSISCRVQYSGQSYAEIGTELGCSEQTVYQVARLRNLSRQLSSTRHSDKTEVANGND